MRTRLAEFASTSRCPYCKRSISPSDYSDYHKNAKCCRKIKTFQQKPLTIQQIMLTYFMQPTQQTLDEAIKGIVEVFVSEEESFSIYSITLALRDLINQGWIRIYGLADTSKPIDLEDSSSKIVNTQELSHREVKEAFLNLLQNGSLDCAVVSHGKFTTYGKVVYSTPVTPVNPPVNIPSSAYPSPTQTPSVDDFTDKIVSYLRNKGEATLKQIQSRLKTKGITCKDIEDGLSRVSEVALEAKGDLSKFVAKIK